MTLIFLSQEYIKSFIVNYNIQNIGYYLTDFGRCYYCHEMFVPDKLIPVMKSCSFAHFLLRCVHIEIHCQFYLSN